MIAVRSYRVTQCLGRYGRRLRSIQDKREDHCEKSLVNTSYERALALDLRVSVARLCRPRTVAAVNRTFSGKRKLHDPKGVKLTVRSPER